MQKALESRQQAEVNRSCARTFKEKEKKGWGCPTKSRGNGPATMKRGKTDCSAANVGGERVQTQRRHDQYEETNGKVRRSARSKEKGNRSYP